MNGLFLREKAIRSHMNVIYECPNFQLTHGNYGIPAGDQYNLCLEQTEDKSVLQLRLCASYDQMKVYLSTVDDATYNRIRQEQGLHVSFSGFAEQLVAILESCRQGTLQAGLLLHAENKRTTLQFYEKRPFRNLIHLYLPVAEAPLELVLHNITQSMQKLQEQHAYQSNQVEALRSELAVKEENTKGLREEVKRLKSALAEQENMIFARNMDEVKNLQHSLKNLNELKDNDERQLKGAIFGLQEKVQRLEQDKGQLTEKLTVAEKRSDNYHAECSRLKQQLCAQNEQMVRVETDLESHKTRDRKQELNLLDLKRQIKDGRDKVSALEKQRSDLIAELEAEKIVCQTKRKALQIATEEITKANDIILKQSKEVAQLRRKGEERAAVALKQEEIIQSTEKELDKLRKQQAVSQKDEQGHQHANNQLTTHIAEMKEFSDKMEAQYKQKILELERRLANSNRLNSNPNAQHRLLTGCRPPVFEL